MAEPVLAALRPHAITKGLVFLGGITGRIHNYGGQLRIVIRLAMQQEQTRLCRDRNTDLVRQLEAASTLEVFLREEDLH